MMSYLKKIVAFATLSLTSGCSFIMGSPPKALASNPEPGEVITPVLIYTSDCNYQKEIDDTGWIGAGTALPASYAAEAVCNALNAELPGAMDAAGIKATFRLRKVDPKSARPSTLKEEAATIVLPPGTSEHQTGLCCDITDEYRSPKNPDELSQTETFKWLNAHCTEYGFILRYPENKQDITKVIYEPWHFRYVGKEVAEYITENDLCLEEFLELYKTEENQ